MSNEANHIGSQSLAYAATVTPDPVAGELVLVGTLTGNVTIANPTSANDTGAPRTGTKLTFVLTQDGTGSRTVTWGSKFKAGAYTASTTAAYVDIVAFVFDGTNWQLVSVLAHTGR